MTAILFRVVIALVMASTLLPTRDATAQGIPGEASAFVQSLADHALGIVADTTLTVRDRERRFQEMFVDSFDVSSIGRYVLGHYWTVASASERAAFLNLFKEMIVTTYVDRFIRYPVKEFAVLASRQNGDTDATVSSSVTRPNAVQPDRVDWRVVKRQGKLVVVDVIVDDVSMGLAQQQEFGSVLQRNGGDIGRLLEMMRQCIEQQAVASRD